TFFVLLSLKSHRKRKFEMLTALQTLSTIYFSLFLLMISFLFSILVLEQLIPHFLNGKAFYKYHLALRLHVSLIRFGLTGQNYQFGLTHQIEQSLNQIVVKNHSIANYFDA